MINDGDENSIEFIKTSNIKEKILSRQTMSAKIHSQKENSPDYLLRPSKVIKCENCEKFAIPPPISWDGWKFTKVPK